MLRINKARDHKIEVASNYAIYLRTMITMVTNLP